MRLLHLTVLWLLGIMQVSAAIDVRNPRWGFGGKPVLGTFNVLSVEVRNTGNGLANAELKLTSDSDGSSFAPYLQPVTLSPGQSRWVQFNVYLGIYRPDFILSWGRESDEAITFGDVQGEKKHGPPAVVVLADPETVRTSRFPVFPEEIFPVSVSATDALHAVFLDHQPRFHAAQAEAFLDWVQLGGIVHLLPGPGGTLPTFDGKLAILNSEEPKHRVGSGWVVKQRFTVADANTARLETAGFPVPAEPPPPNLDADGYGRYGESNSDTAFFQTLAMVTRPKISWWLIYLLTGVYVLIIGPVFFLLRKRDYRVLLCGFVATVALFAWLFTVIGRRGYGERQVCHSLAVARVLGGGRFDVTHWSHAFATSGNTYRFAYPGASQLYAAIGQGGEKVRGSVHLGGDAFFEADIPLFSFRNFMHRGVMTGDNVAATLVSVPKTDPARGLDPWHNGFKATLGAEVPGEVIAAALQVGDYYVPAQINGREVNVRGYSSGSGVEILRGAREGSHSDYDPRVSGFGGPEAALGELRRDGANLAQRVFGDSTSKQRGIGHAPGKETLRLYIYAVAPRAFRLADSEFATDKNYVLYVQDFAIPAASSSP
jgi:hypothetical protein